MTLSSKIRQTFQRTAATAPPVIPQGGGGSSSSDNDNTPDTSWTTQGPTLLLFQQVEQSVDFPSNTLVLGFDDYNEYHHDSDEEEEEESESARRKQKGPKKSTTQQPLVWLVDSLPV
jgi:hypothetical protein